MLRFDRKLQNSVKQLSFSKKNKKKRSFFLKKQVNKKQHDREKDRMESLMKRKQWNRANI